MAASVTEAQRRDFINQMAVCARSSFARIGKVLPSVAVAMACVECAYGTAGSCKYHSYFGHKVGTGKTALTFWDGTSVNLKTAEEYQPGVYTNTRANFRTYKSMQQCCDNFYELLNTPLYKTVQHGADYVTQMNQIKACGYMTSSTEVNTVISIIQKYQLYDLDGQAEKKPQYHLPNGSDKEVKVKIKTLRQWDKGSQVRFLQMLLNGEGYNLSADGLFGEQTTEQVKAFQKAAGLVADGIAGVNTWTKLLHEALLE